MVDFEENTLDDADSSNNQSEVSVEDVALLTFQVETAINVSNEIATRPFTSSNVSEARVMFTGGI